MKSKICIREQRSVFNFKYIYIYYIAYFRKKLQLGLMTEKDNLCSR